MEDKRDRQKLRMMPTSSGGNVASHHHVDVSPMRDAQDRKVVLRLLECMSERKWKISLASRRQREISRKRIDSCFFPSKDFAVSSEI